MKSQTNNMQEFNRNELAKAKAKELSWANSYLLEAKAERQYQDKENERVVILPDIDIETNNIWFDLRARLTFALTIAQVERAKQIFKLEVEELADELYGN